MHILSFVIIYFASYVLCDIEIMKSTAKDHVSIISKFAFSKTINESANEEEIDKKTFF